MLLHLIPLIPRLLMYRPLFSLAESFADNVIRDTVDEPAAGGIVWCDLAGGYATHSGIYIGDNRIVHLSGDGEVMCSDRKTFMGRLDGLNPAMSVYTDCEGNMPVGNIAAAGRAWRALGSRHHYHLITGNCHRFTVECLTGRPDNGTIFHRQLTRMQRGNTWRVWEE